MEASSRKRKSAALASIDADPLPGAGEEDGGAGEEGGAADRLSGLPDDVLGQVISLLTTNEAARTGILALRWRDLWLSAPLNLDCRDLTVAGEITVRPDVRADVRADVVSRILSSHHGPVRRFYIDSYRVNVPADTLEACLQSAALDNLEELGLMHHRLEQPHRALFRFCRTLRVANIGRCDLSDVSFQGLHLPLLKELGLASVTISECSLHTLMVGCPALECLLIYMCAGFRCLRINSLTIRSVSVRQVACSAAVIQPEHVVIENAPCLLRLLLLEDKLDVSIVAAPKLETLGFIGEEHYCGSTLVFGSTVIQDLCVDKLITVWRTVKILALDMGNLCLDTVIELMRCFPCLEKLSIRSLSPESRSDNLWRRKHQKLIKSLDLRLKTIVLTTYWGLKSQINFVLFFVLNANLLASVTLGIKDYDNNEEFLAEQRMKLQIENGASKDVRLHFTTDRDFRNFYRFRDVRDYDLMDPFTLV